MTTGKMTKNVLDLFLNDYMTYNCLQQNLLDLFLNDYMTYMTYKRNLHDADYTMQIAFCFKGGVGPARRSLVIARYRKKFLFF